MEAVNLFAYANVLQRNNQAAADGHRNAVIGPGGRVAQALLFLKCRSIKYNPENIYAWSGV